LLASGPVTRAEKNRRHNLIPTPIIAPDLAPIRKTVTQQPHDDWLLATRAGGAQVSVIPKKPASYRFSEKACPREAGVMLHQ